MGHIAAIYLCHMAYIQFSHMPATWYLYDHYMAKQYSCYMDTIWMAYG